MESLLKKPINISESLIDLRFGDCKDILPLIPDNFIDTIICDLPFGKTACDWDIEIPNDFLWFHYKRIIKEGGAICLFGTEPFSTHLRMSNIEGYKYDWIWDKHIPRGMHIATKRPMQKHENISVFTANGETPNYYPIMTARDRIVKVKNYGNSKTSPLSKNDKEVREYTHKGPDSILVGYWEANNGKFHPTQKPVSLLEYLIRTYTLAGQLVLDNCMGSGTTGIACRHTYRNFIGIEKSKQYFDIAEARINDTPQKEE